MTHASRCMKENLEAYIQYHNCTVFRFSTWKSRILIGLLPASFFDVSEWVDPRWPIFKMFPRVCKPLILCSGAVWDICARTLLLLCCTIVIHVLYLVSPNLAGFEYAKNFFFFLVEHFKMLMLLLKWRTW